MLQNDAAGSGNGHRGVFSAVARRTDAALRADEDRLNRSDGLAGERGRRAWRLASRFSTFSR